MKNRNCPNKDACWDYNASNCTGCELGEKFSRLTRQIKQLKSKNAELRRHAEVVERAFDNTIKVFHEMLSAIFPSIKIDLDEWKKDNLEIAEKELAEERE